MWRTVFQRLRKLPLSRAEPRQCSCSKLSSCCQSANTTTTGLSKSKTVTSSGSPVWKFVPLPRSVGTMATRTLESLNLDNRALASLPVDDIESNTVRKVSGACYCLVQSTPVTNPRLVLCSQSALQLLDLPETETQRPEFVEYFSGNKTLPGSQQAAHCYCGHQFGYFAGQLGDGAAIYLGEVVNEAGERWEFQIKGAGKTPFSRTADGRKVLRSSIREFLCSEAIHHLGIPTTRAGACITSDTTVIRDVYYDGNAQPEKATIVLRMAPSFIRFGSFEIFKDTDPETGRQGPSVGRVDILKQLTEHVIKTYYPQIEEEFGADPQSMYREFFREVVKRTAHLVAQWQSVGWCHGVLNTDNMSILGLTIDYGPYGFLDRYEAGFICNSSDDGGRYAFDKQPEICQWNCMKLAEALHPLISMDQTQPVLQTFDQEYSTHYLDRMRRKLGLLNKALKEDSELVESLLSTMEETGADFTNTFRGLSELPLPGCADTDTQLKSVTEYLLGQCSSLLQLKEAYKPRMEPRQLQMFIQLLEMNPHLLSQMGKGFRAISQELDRIEKSKKLQDMTRSQKAKSDLDLWQQWLQKYQQRLALETEGSTDVQATNQRRISVMNDANPRFVLRNYIAQNAIEAAEKGDFSEVRRVLKLLENPYSESEALPSAATEAESDAATADGTDRGHAVSYDSKPPAWATGLRVT